MACHSSTMQNTAAIRAKCQMFLMDDDAEATAFPSLVMAGQATLVLFLLLVDLVRVPLLLPDGAAGGV